MKRWLYLHLTWMGREERRLVREFDRQRQIGLDGLRDSPVYTCTHERREPNGDATAINRHSDRYDYYDPERCLDCGTGVVKVRRKRAPGHAASAWEAL